VSKTTGVLEIFHSYGGPAEKKKSTNNYMKRAPKIKKKSAAEISWEGRPDDRGRKISRKKSVADRVKQDEGKRLKKNFSSRARFSDKLLYEQVFCKKESWKRRKKTIMNLARLPGIAPMGDLSGRAGRSPRMEGSGSKERKKKARKTTVNG